jgi:hypothetical protein
MNRFKKMLSNIKTKRTNNAKIYISGQITGLEIDGLFWPSNEQKQE